MIEDNKNNDTKEELKKSSDDNNMDIQEIDENKDLKNTEIDQKKEDSNDQLEEQREKEVKEQKAEESSEEIKEQKEEAKEEKTEESSEEIEEKHEDTLTDDEKDDPDAKWYIVGAASGFEEKAVKTIQDNARKASLNHFFFDFQIPKQEVIEIKKGKKINSEKNFFPGYMLIKMIMNNQTWQLVKNSNKVSGFTGNDHKPIPLSQNEAMKMLKKADDSIEYIAPKYVYEVGQQVKVIDGPFASFNGMVEEVDEERGRLKISVSIFGRSTPVELEYTQVEKV
jgi:transcriptional antiterminator NusG